jgi:hypothetical protein
MVTKIHVNEHLIVGNLIINMQEWFQILLCAYRVWILWDLASIKYWVRERLLLDRVVITQMLLSVCLVKHRAMTTYGGVSVVFSSVLFHSRRRFEWVIANR